MPTGVVVLGFCGEVSKEGSKIVHRAKLEQTRCHHKETLGKRLGVSMAMENALTKQWTHITEVCDKANGGKDPDDHRT